MDNNKKQTKQGAKKDETEHKLKNMQRIITRNRQENSWLFGIKKQAG